MMQNRMKVFKNDQLGRLTVYDFNGEPYFIGREVASILGYTNPLKAIRTHVCDEDKGVNKTVTPGGSQEVIFINESGLYSLVLSSKMKQAKAFKRWVTKEVLPSIRRNGGYIMGQESKNSEEILADAILVADRIIKEKNSKIEELSPKAEYYDRLVSSGHLTNLRNTAKEFNIPQNEFIRFLLDKKLLYRDKKSRLLPYAKTNYGYFEVKEWMSSDGEAVGVQTFVTPKGKNCLLIMIGGGDGGE